MSAANDSHYYEVFAFNVHITFPAAGNLHELLSMLEFVYDYSGRLGIKTECFARVTEYLEINSLVNGLQNLFFFFLHLSGWKIKMIVVFFPFNS